MFQNNWTFTFTKLNIDLFFIPITKIKSECNIALNVKCKIM